MSYQHQQYQGLPYGAQQYPPAQRTTPPNPAATGGSPAPSSLQTLLNNQDMYSLQNTNGTGNGNGGTMATDDEYNRLLKNYRLAHEKLEERRLQMLEQEKQNALLRKHISLLEGSDAGSAFVVGAHLGGGGGVTVDDFTIKNSSSSLERRINRWAADTLTLQTSHFPPRLPGSTIHPYIPFIPLLTALYDDLPQSARESPLLSLLERNGWRFDGVGLVAQSLARHAVSKVLADGLINRLLVTDSEEANSELTKLHDSLFNREPLVASVWRRQTFSAAVRTLSPHTALSILQERVPHLLRFLQPPSSSPSQSSGDLQLIDSLRTLLEAAYTFSRMLHSSKSPGAGGKGATEGSGFYMAFVPEVGEELDPSRLELVKKCGRTDRGERERVGACLFPGLIKVSAVDTSPATNILNGSSPNGSGGFGSTYSSLTGGSPSKSKNRETRFLVVRRAQVICECALAAAGKLPVNEFEESTNAHSSTASH